MDILIKEIMIVVVVMKASELAEVIRKVFITIICISKEVNESNTQNKPKNE